MGVKLQTRINGRVTTGFDEAALIAEIRQTGDKAVKGISDVMRDEGEQIRDLARDMAPHDDGYLEKAIKTEDYKDPNKRLAVTVYVDGDMPGSHDGKNVGDYAILMHEGLGPYGDGTYKPGEGTMAKIYAGFKAGGKFLERAFLQRRRFLLDRAAAAVKKVLK